MGVLLWRLVKLSGSSPQAGANQPELTGYHVKRDEFEPEYDVEAEHLVAELDFVPGEPQVGCRPPQLSPCRPALSPASALAMSSQDQGLRMSA